MQTNGAIRGEKLKVTALDINRNIAIMFAAREYGNNFFGRCKGLKHPNCKDD